MAFTHRELVQIAYRWVLNNTSCGIAFKELSTIGDEIPDVIGFGQWGHSVLIECKTSRSDFLADRKKIFRQYPEMGVGSHRFYFAPKDLIKVEELPTGWGLIEVNEKGKAKCKKKLWTDSNDERTPSNAKNTKAEYSLMYSALRRLHIRNRIDEIYLSIPEKEATP